jgi:hypothetical protein
MKQVRCVELWMTHCAPRKITYKLPNLALFSVG